MGKTIDELLPSDDVVIEIGATQEMDAVTRKLITVKAVKQQVVKKAYFDDLEVDDTGRMVQFDCAIVGTPVYETRPALNLPGTMTKIMVGVEPLETETGRMMAEAKRISEERAEAIKKEDERLAREQQEAQARAIKAQADKEEADRKASEKLEKEREAAEKKAAKEIADKAKADALQQKQSEENAQ